MPARSRPQVSARAVRGELRLRAEMDSRGHTVLTERVHAGSVSFEQVLTGTVRRCWCSGCNPTAVSLQVMC